MTDLKQNRRAFLKPIMALAALGRLGVLSLLLTADETLANRRERATIRTRARTWDPRIQRKCSRNDGRCNPNRCSSSTRAASSPSRNGVLGRLVIQAKAKIISVVDRRRPLGINLDTAARRVERAC